MTMSVKEALDQVLGDMKAMSPEELKKDLEKHSKGEFATTLREMTEVANGVLYKEYNRIVNRVMIGLIISLILLLIGLMIFT